MRKGLNADTIHFNTLCMQFYNISFMYFTIFSIIVNKMLINNSINYNSVYYLLYYCMYV
jgi:hypothetical protein